MGVNSVWRDEKAKDRSYLFSYYDHWRSSMHACSLNHPRRKFLHWGLHYLFHRKDWHFPPGNGVPHLRLQRRLTGDGLHGLSETIGA